MVTSSQWRRQVKRPMPTEPSLKATVKNCIRAIGDTWLFAPVVYNPAVKRLLSTLPGSRVFYDWDRIHPFDVAHGTDTSGFVSSDKLTIGHPAEEHGSPYAGAQPSVLRAALKSLPSLQDFTFIDLGCGKGRPMLVATEFPFRDIVGVELSPSLCNVAQKNADAMAARFPERPRVRVECGDATAFPMPEGNVLLFVYNSFDRELMDKVAENVEAALLTDPQRIIYVVYCNPVSGASFDESKRLQRRFAKTIPYTLQEQGYAPDTEDAVIIWQGGNAPAVAEPANAQIVIVKERWRAALA